MEKNMFEEKANARKQMARAMRAKQREAAAKTGDAHLFARAVDEKLRALIVDLEDWPAEQAGALLEGLERLRGVLDGVDAQEFYEVAGRVCQGRLRLGMFERMKKGK